MRDRTAITPRMRLPLVTAIAVLVSLAAAPGSAAAKPGATVKKLSGAPASAQAGGTFGVRVRVAAGRRRAPAGAVVVLLSADRRAGRSDVRAGKARLRALKPRRASTVRVRVHVPARTPAGRRYVIACVASRKGRLSKVRGACRAPKAATAITAGGGAGTTAPPMSTTAAPSPTPGQSATPTATPAPEPGNGTDPATPLETPDPVAVTPVAADGSTSSSKRIGSAGGTLTATAPDGSAFELVIPANSLLSEIEVTMTPLASVGGLPFSGGLAAGVELLPHGLRLNEPAKLTITPAAPVALADQSPFAYSEGGADFRLYPLSADPSKLEMSLMHFSGYGVAEGTQFERDSQAAHAPADPEAQFEQRAQQALEKAREGDVEGANADLDALNAEYYAKVVKPRLLAAETDDNLANLAATTFLAWARQIAIMGREAEFATQIAEGMASLGRIHDNAYTKAFERCRAGETGEAVTMLSYARQHAMTGIGTKGDTVMEDIQQCVRYELDYTGSSAWVKQRSSSQDTHFLRAHAWIPLELSMDATDWHLAGSVNPEVLDYRVEDTYTGSCPFTAVGTEVQEPMVVRAYLDLNPRRQLDDAGKPVVDTPPASTIVYVKQAKIRENYAYCGTNSWDFTHNGSFSLAHASRKIAETGEFVFDEWAAGTLPEVGRFEQHFDGTNFSGGAVDFDTTLILRHDPTT